jgi:vacuolar-type H+-ATPase catalytic subunit A/Vma1
MINFEVKKMPKNLTLEEWELVLKEKEWQRDQLILEIDEEIKNDILQENAETKFLTGDMTTFNKYIEINMQIQSIEFGLEDIRKNQ